ncbi:hypothetical protein [Streptomyces sp. NRRL F-2799]|uniref:hypothetical protein n=1 Tax=Streptomyces sp. NRRL F-2799 TaxID=1463844 RepID=UPI0004C52149|nr:hypothetical protein [Streptomyces sp. NRRL F-2799]
MSAEVVLSKDDLRAVTGFAAASAWVFARGGERGKVLRDTAWAALKAAQDAHTAAGREPARAAMAAAAYLHPLAKATQVKHILGAWAHAARAAEPAAGESADGRLERRGAAPEVIDVLRRYPSAPDGGGRVGELTRLLDAALRARPE